MALWRAGRISDAVLEVYRVAAVHDGRDPLAVLRERWLPVPQGSGLTDLQPDPVQSLYAAARDYLLTLAHPGAVVDRWLDPALQAVACDQPRLAAAIGAAAGQLGWVIYDSYPRHLIGEAFCNGHAFASILGGTAPFSAADVDLGLLLIAPGVLYRDHGHPAPELYAPLTGPHGWRFGPGRPLILKPAHQPAWNPPDRPHPT